MNLRDLMESAIGTEAEEAIQVCLAWCAEVNDDPEKRLPFFGEVWSILEFLIRIYWILDFCYANRGRI